MELKLDRRILGIASGALVMLIGLIDGILRASSDAYYGANNFQIFLAGFSVPFAVGTLIVLVSVFWGEKDNS